MLILVNGAIILYLLTQVIDLITLLNDDSFSDTLIESELQPVTYSPVKKLVDLTGVEETVMQPDRELLIPKLIHQTYKTTEVPMKWNHTYSSIRALHPDYVYMFWTDDNSRDFIEQYYPWFLDTFDSYPYNIMRADVIRYFVLVHYGGIYIDLDNGCDFNMDPLRAFPAWLRKTDPSGVSNDIMGSVPRHPFFLKVLDNLQKYNRNYLLPYATIMYSSGPLMLSVLLKQYNRWGKPPAGGEVRLLAPPDHKMHMTFFFSQARGSSWHEWDAKLILFIGDHCILAAIVITSLVLSFFYVQYKIYQDPRNAMYFALAVVHRFKRWTKWGFKKVRPAATGTLCSSRANSPNKNVGSGWQLLARRTFNEAKIDEDYTYDEKVYLV